MAKKLAITISGAVSLGSYEAGVLYEIIRTIQHHNEKEQNPANQIEIDVLTGASAGGMTAAIAAQKLLYEASSLEEPYNNSLYRAWVKDVNFDGLFNLQSGEPPTHSILSSNHVEDISKKHVTARYASPVAPVSKKHPAAANTIQLGLALTNLNGVDYVRPLRTGGEFCYTKYQDKLLSSFNAGNPQHDSIIPWEIVRNAAVACGAFPFAFRTKDLVRHYDEYKSPYLPPIPKGSFPEQTRIFTYTDGGTFENEPLGMAKNLVDALGPTHDGRFYLFVSPSKRDGTSNSQFNEKIANFGETAKAIVSCIFNQARFHDWITAEKLNEKIHLLDDRADDLHDVIIKGQINPNDLSHLSASLLPLLYKNPAEIQAAQNRLKFQYQNYYQGLIQAKGLSIADSWIDAVSVFEKAACLDDKDEMQIFGITASDKELAGSGLEAFLGFFDQAYRDHDYDVGRTKARKFISDIHQNNKVDLWFPHHPDNNPAVPRESWMEIRQIDAKLNGLQLKNVSEELRQKFRDRLIDKANDVLEEMKISWIGRKAIILFFVKPKLNAWIGLE